MRKFRLINSIGEAYDLNDPDFYLYNPSSLGFKKQINFKKIGHSFQEISEMVAQPEPTGIIRFRNPDAYDKYYSFLRFAAKMPLRLEYTPAATTYHLDCYIKEIGKTELEGDGLHNAISLIGLGYYYRFYEQESGVYPDDGKIYNYEYSYTYRDHGSGTLGLDVDSDMDSPIKISIYGPVTNPVWKHYINNVLVEIGSATLVIPQNRRLVIDTTTIPYTITEQDMIGNIKYDRYADADFETDRFFFLKEGNNRISVSQGGVMVPKLKIEGKILYESV